MIDGFRLTIPGEELRRLLEKRVDDHRRRADRWKREQARTPDDQTEDAPLLADHICENEADRHDWRAAVLEFIRDRVEPAEVYRLGEADLLFGELLPEKPGWLEQAEYEERTGVAFNLERLAKRVGDVLPMAMPFAAEHRTRVLESERVTNSIDEPAAARAD
jgi:hypothetical protein